MTMTTLETVNYELYAPPTSPIVPTELEEIVAVTTSQGVQMLPLDGEKLHSHKLAVVAYLGEKIVGYCASTYHYNNTENSLMEVGALVVLPEHRHHGIAKDLVPKVTASVHNLGLGAIAFCNPASAPIFEEANYQLASAEQVPAEAIEPCNTCPMQKLHKNGICCDEVYVNIGDNSGSNA